MAQEDWLLTCRNSPMSPSTTSRHFTTASVSLLVALATAYLHERTAKCLYLQVPTSFFGSVLAFVTFHEGR